jgi:hypothetical protein
MVGSKVEIITMSTEAPDRRNLSTNILSAIDDAEASKREEEHYGL